MSSLKDGNMTEERLAVAVGDAADMKFLGVPAYQPGTDRRAGEKNCREDHGVIESVEC